MPATTKLPTWAVITLVTFAALFTLRYLAAIDAGVSHVAAIRTYTFWALVIMPVAYVADVVIRTVLSYRVVQLAVARVQNRRGR